MSEWIAWLAQVDKSDVRLVGGKAANLGDMLRAGFPIPSGFSITADAYRRQLDKTSIGNKLEQLLAERAGDDDALSTAISALFESAPMLPEIAEDMRRAYRELGSDCLVAVRSSATAEDLAEASFAGQQETFLGVRGEEGLIRAVQRCWASLWSARAVAYRERQGVSHSSVAISVVVQEMVDAEVAGVMFTVDPVSGARDRLVINASYGLGEAVVSGAVTPDSFIVSRSGPAIISRGVAVKDQMVVLDEHSTRTVPVPPERQAASSLSDAEVLELARLGLRVEEHHGSPQDIEWAIAGGALHLLQSRPITTLGRELAEVELPGMEEGVYGWASFERLPGFLRSRFVPIFLDHFPEPLRPFDIYTSLAQALKGGGMVAAQLGIKLPEGVAVAHPSGLVLFRVPFPSLARVILHLPIALLHLRRWIRYDPLREWQQDEPYLRSMLAGSNPKEPIDMSEEELLAEIDRVGTVIQENMRLRFRKYLPPLIPAQRRLRALLRRAVGGRAAEYQNRLLQGLDYKTARINRYLRVLARMARAKPRVLEILSTAESGKVVSTLSADPNCSDFLVEFSRFLHENGARSAGSMEPQPSYPAWQDQPEVVLALVAALAHAEDGRLAEEAVRNEEYVQARHEVARLLGDPGLAKQFEQAADTVRGASLARDDTFYFFEECVDRIRRCSDQLGRMFASKGKLQEARDLYYLSPVELRTLADSASGTDEAEAIDKLATLRGRVWNQMRGERNPSGASVGSRNAVLKGVAASAGKAVGTARVIDGAGAFGKLTSGDVLVCPSTSPAWTPLFSIASAVVTDAGGAASHAAIVAREYGIPAVMGCGNATRVLADGDLIEVDGAAGTARRLR